MKVTKKMVFWGMIGLVLVFGFVLASCSNVFMGNVDSPDPTKTVKVTLKSKSYKVEYNGKTYSGNSTKISLLGIDSYTFTSGCTSGAASVYNKKLTTFAFLGSDGVGIIATDLPKKNVAAGEVYLDEIELIIIEDDDD